MYPENFGCILAVLNISAKLLIFTFAFVGDLQMCKKFSYSLVRFKFCRT